MFLFNIQKKIILHLELNEINSKGLMKIVMKKGLQMNYQILFINLSFTEDMFIESNRENDDLYRENEIFDWKWGNWLYTGK